MPKTAHQLQPNDSQPLPDDIWSNIASFLGNEEIALLSEAKNHQFGDNLAKGLFQSQNDIALKSKGKLLVQWQKQKNLKPIPKNQLLNALINLEFKKQLIGLDLISSHLIKEKPIVSSDEFNEFSSKINTNSFSTELPPNSVFFFFISGKIIPLHPGLSFLFLLNVKQRKIILQNIVLSFKKLPPSEITMAIKGYLIYGEFFNKTELDEIISLLLNLLKNPETNLQTDAIDTLESLVPMLSQSQISKILNLLLASSHQEQLNQKNILKLLSIIIPSCKGEKNKLILEFMLPFLDSFNQNNFYLINGVFKNLILILDEKQKEQILDYVLPLLNNSDTNVAEQSLTIFLELVSHFNTEKIKKHQAIFRTILDIFANKTNTILNILGNFYWLKQEEKTELIQLVQPYLYDSNIDTRLAALNAFTKLAGMPDKEQLDSLFNEIIGSSLNKLLEARAYTFIINFAVFFDSQQKTKALQTILSFTENLNQAHFLIILTLFTQLIENFNPDEKNKALEQILNILENQNVLYTLMIATDCIDTINRELATKLFTIIKSGLASENLNICFRTLKTFDKLILKLSHAEVVEFHENIKPLLTHTNDAIRYTAILLLEKIGKYDSYCEHIIGLIQNPNCIESIKTLALEHFTTFLIIFLSGDQDEFRQIALNSLKKIRYNFFKNKVFSFLEIQQAVLRGEVFSSTVQYELLLKIKTQIQRAEWAVQLEQLKTKLVTSQVTEKELRNFLLNPLLQPLSAQEGFAPASELQKNIIEVLCKSLSINSLIKLSNSIIDLSLHHEALIATDTVGETIIAYALAVYLPINHTNLSEEYLLRLNPLIEKIKNTYFLVSEEEKNFHWALGELNQQKEEAKHVLYKGAIEQLITQINAYKEQNKVSLPELTDILNDTTDLLRGKISAESYTNKANFLYGTKSTPKQILGLSLMLFSSIFSIASIVLTIIAAAALPALALSIISIVLVSTGIALFVKGHEHKGLAKDAEQLAEIFEVNASTIAPQIAS
ncbi:MAG: vacuolar protein sorting-associated protein 35 [Proteobacteria bacterium]|nr:vacuolar protein sorting-associated protein 35 [Pseudomonadota bacterium]